MFRKIPKVFDKNENRSTPLGATGIPGPEAFVRTNRPVYKGPIPLKDAKSKIQVVMNISRDPMNPSTNHTPYDIDDEVYFSMPRTVPRPKLPPGPPIVNPRPKPMSQVYPKRPGFPPMPRPHIQVPPPRPPPPNLPPPKAARRAKQETPKPINIVNRPALDSDSESEYSNDDLTVYSEVPPTPPPKPKSKPTTNDLLKRFPTPPDDSRKPPPLREVLKPVNQHDLPIEYQKDLLPPNSTTFDERFRAARAREHLAKKKEQLEKVKLERGITSNDPTAHSTPSRAYQAASQQVWPSPAVYHNGKHTRNASDTLGSKATRVYHAPSSSADSIPNLSLGRNAHLRDGPAARRVVVNNGLPLPVGPQAHNVDYASMTTGHMGPPPSTRPLNIHSRKESKSSMDTTNNSTTATRTFNDCTRPRLGSDVHQGHSRGASEFGRLPPHPAVHKRQHFVNASYGDEYRGRRT